MKRSLVLIAIVLLVASCATMGKMFTVVSTSRLRVGMTKAEVEAVEPYPQKINRTVVGNVVHEQWVFKNAISGSMVYLYFENGILVGWQD